ncbi:unnamed protein product [Auanema sp. JU1783]|nr:unnamed protein product [Auanema sp. JU1783]
MLKIIYSHLGVFFLQASFLSKSITIDDKMIELNIWDTAGQEKYHALGPIYYRGSHGALLIYDITDQQSFVKVKVWVKELQRALGDSVSLFIIGNKLDLESNRTINYEEATEYAKSVGASYAETSAKENLGICNVFEELCRAMLEAAKENPNNNRGNVSNTRRTIELMDDEPSSRKSKCC